MMLARESGGLLMTFAKESESDRPRAMKKCIYADRGQRNQEHMQWSGDEVK